MKKFSFVHSYVLLSFIYGGLFYVISHLNQYSSIDTSFKVTDILLVINLILFFPALFTGKTYLKQIKTNKRAEITNRQVEQMRKNDVKVAQAQMATGSEVWNSRNTGDTLAFIVRNFFLYLIIFLFAILIDLITLVKKYLS
ncbi:hypothetical protein GNF18_03505 [Ligilactobacillus pobuzihii]|uniref:hypothetical protein n=1 Tax=Ligilactobacillus pobuzihii TaxID=449659 RepID=UPI0019D12C60|nr:hypothetical protein [Ligilactobacillus pobuzihii]MBN7274229.1 hypothetical protein [Ligilactobacillus pobuzihii]